MIQNTVSAAIRTIKTTTTEIPPKNGCQKNDLQRDCLQRGSSRQQCSANQIILKFKQYKNRRKNGGLIFLLLSSRRLSRVCLSFQIIRQNIFSAKTRSFQSSAKAALTKAPFKRSPARYQSMGLTIFLQSISPRSSPCISTSAVAMLVATGTL